MDNPSGEIYGKFFGIATQRLVRIVMCGGCQEWWNYVLEFENDGGDDYKLYREDRTGMKYMGGLLIIDLENQTARQTFLTEEDALKQNESGYKMMGESEGLVDYDTFFDC